jgi:Nif-specific regulatory protein
MAKALSPAVVDGRESRRLSTLLEVSQALSGTLNMRSALDRVLEILAKHHGYVRSMITLLHENGELHVEASDGIDSPAHSVRYRIGEGIIGKVVESGKPIVVPRVSKEPAFLNRASKRSEAAKEELSFICVPIMLNRRAVGAIAVDNKFKPDRDYERTVKFLGIVASNIAQAIKIQRLIEDDKKRLVQENTQLRQELKERYDFSGIIGSSGPVRQMYEQMAQVASANTTVLIRGESGTVREGELRGAT